jgi:hypothetical protein
MNDPSDRIALLLSPSSRLEIAMACRGSPATKYEIAKKLGRQSGGLSAIEILEREGVLLRVSVEGRQRPRGRGIRWRLNPEWTDAVDEAASRLKKGILSAGMDLILIPTTDVVRACGLFERPSMGALSELSVRPVRLHLPSIMNEAEARAWAKGIGNSAAKVLPAREGEGD